MRLPFPLLLSVLAAVLLAGCSESGGGSTPSPSAGEALGGTDSTFPTRYYLNASLEPPVTRYFVVSHSLNPIFGAGAGERALGDDGHTFTWTTTNKCGRFEPRNSTAVWHHGDDTNCDHSSTAHAGTVTVVIGGFANSTSSTGYGTCEYKAGSVTGQSDACFVSSVAPDGLEPARRTSLPFPATAALAASALVAWALSSRRRRS